MAAVLATDGWGVTFDLEPATFTFDMNWADKMINPAPGFGPNFGPSAPAAQSRLTVIVFVKDEAVTCFCCTRIGDLWLQSFE